MVGCGWWVTDLQGHCLWDHIPEVFRDLSRTGEDFGRVRTSALQTIPRVLGGGEVREGPIYVCGRAAGHYSMPGGPLSGRLRWRP